MASNVLFIPMYNCENQVTRVLDSLDEEVCSTIDLAIVVDNRSTDGSLAKVIRYLETLNAKRKFVSTLVLENDENYGLGGSHKVAFNFAIEQGFDHLIVLHGDDQASIQDLLPYLRSEEYQGYDRFLGSRFMKGSELKGYSAFRTFGNKVYNHLFSLVSHHRVFDLGAGLNLYRIESLKDRYGERFEDDLVIDYYMTLADGFYHKAIQFFPITWREEDQVSNVKLASQAARTLRILASYLRNSAAFMEEEHRAHPHAIYSAKVVFELR